MLLLFTHLPVSSMLNVNVYSYPTECSWQPSAQCDCRCNCSVPTVFSTTCLLCLNFRKIWKTLCYTNISKSVFPLSLFRFMFFLFSFDCFSPIVLFCFPLPLFLILLSIKLNDALLRIFLC